MELYIAAIVGALIYGVIDFLGKGKKEVFSKKYLLTIVINVAAGAFLIWLIDMKPNSIVFKDFDITRIIAATVGILGMKIFKLVVKLSDKYITDKLKNLFSN